MPAYPPPCVASSSSSSSSAAAVDLITSREYYYNLAERRRLLRRSAIVYAAELCRQRYRTPSKEASDFFAREERGYLVAVGGRELHYQLLAAYHRAFPSLDRITRPYSDEFDLVYHLRTIPPLSRLDVAQMAGLMN